MNAAPYITGPLNADMGQRVRSLIFTGMTLAALVFLRFFNPVGSGFYPPCVFHQLTGLYCPGCGSTRALHQLVNGHPSAALAMNPLLVIMLPLIIYAFLSYALLGIRGRGLPRIFVHPKLIKLLLFIVVAFGVLRNLPFHPFNLLAPHTL
jgi:hypothetical protein